MVKVLVVEDEASIREMIALNLRLAGMEAVEADSAEAAPPLLAQKPGPAKRRSRLKNGKHFARDPGQNLMNAIFHSLIIHLFPDITDTFPAAVFHNFFTISTDNRHESFLKGI